MDGYLISVDFDGQQLRVHAKNGPAAIALTGDKETRDVTLPRDQIASAVYVKPKVLGAVNGHVDVTSTAGKLYRLHFRKKSTAGFRELATALGAH